VLLLEFTLAKRVDSALLVRVDLPPLKAGLTRTISTAILFSLLLLELILLLSGLFLGLSL
jgi:hypothetical protein